MPETKLFLLGSPRLEQADALIEIQRRKAKALLIFLAVTHEAHQREKLATLLWPDSSQQQALGSLRRNLSELNNLLEGDWVDTNRETVGLVPTAEIWLDINQFHQHLAACQSHDHSPEKVCPACIVPLTEAVTLYRDDFLAGFTLPDCPEF